MARCHYVRSTLGAALLMLAVSATVHGSFTEHRAMYLRFAAPVTLPRVALAPGTYIFELADPRADPRIVRVLSRDRSTVYFMAFTEMVPRPAGLPPDVGASFGEAARGGPVPITAWYPAGDANGRLFVYPADRPARSARTAPD